MKLNKLISRNAKPKLVLLIDPDKYNPELIKLSVKYPVAFFLVGGSELKKDNLTEVIKSIKKISKKPVIIFPGDEKQISKDADGLLLLSLISGRNAEYLIGKHVKAASIIKQTGIATMSTGYILINGEKISTTQKITKTKAINSRATKLITDTAIAGELLGLHAIYLEAGSGARITVNSKNIKAVKKLTNLPLIVGGGIDSLAKAKKVADSGANYVVIGNALEKNISLLSEIAKAF
jgi:putative glycerol-1-phosphate prenyltransferase